MNQEIYDAAIKNGCTPRMAEMLAARKGPGLNTDTSWWAGNTHFSEEHGDEYAERTRKLVERHGGHMGPHDDYIPWLARFPGDPNAVISGMDAKSGIARAAETHQAEIVRRKTKPAPPLAPDLVEEKVSQVAPDHDKLPAKEKQKLKQEIIEKHAYKPEGE